MKTKLTAIGIILCLVTACGINNSDKNETKNEMFDPHSLNGVYIFDYNMNVSLPDSLCESSDCFRKVFYTDYIYVDYPFFHVCIVKPNYSPFTTVGKEEVKVARAKGHIYEVEEINGHTATINNVSYKITGDSSLVDGHTNYHLYVSKIKNGNEHYGVGFQNYSSDSDLDKEYQQCISEASDTTGIFPSNQQLAVKPR